MRKGKRKRRKDEETKELAYSIIGLASQKSIGLIRHSVAEVNTAVHTTRGFFFLRVTSVFLLRLSNDLIRPT